MTQITLTEAGVSVTYLATEPGTGPGAVDHAVRDLHDLNECIAALTSWREDVLTPWLADALGRNGIDVDGVGHVEIKRGTDRKEWDKANLLRMVLDSRRRPLDDGELDPRDQGHAEVAGEEITCSQDLARFLDVFNPPAPRVTALRDRGIDPDEFCASSPGKLSVVITP